MNKVFKYIVIDILRNKTVLFYTLFLMVVSFTLFSFEENTAKGLLSLLNIILFIVPLISIIFSTIYIYNCSEFIELLICQPLKRKYIWLSLFNGLAASLSFAFLIGCGIPILIYEPTATGLIMILTGCLLSVIFVAISMLGTVSTRDKAKGIGKAIFLWLYFALIFDNTSCQSSSASKSRVTLGGVSAGVSSGTGKGSRAITSFGSTGAVDFALSFLGKVVDGSLLTGSAGAGAVGIACVGAGVTDTTAAGTPSG